MEIQKKDNHTILVNRQEVEEVSFSSLLMEKKMLTQDIERTQSYLDEITVKLTAVNKMITDAEALGVELAPEAKDKIPEERRAQSIARRDAIINEEK